MTPAKEPVIYSNILSAVMALLGALVALNVINLLPEQMQAVESALGAVLMVAGPAISTLLARRASTPLVEPRDETGAELVRKVDGRPTRAAQARSLAK